jgi:hypothetical protein
MSFEDRVMMRFLCYPLFLDHFTLNLITPSSSSSSFASPSWPGRASSGKFGTDVERGHAAGRLGVRLRDAVDDELLADVAEPAIPVGDPRRCGGRRPFAMISSGVWAKNVVQIDLNGAGTSRR